MLGRLFSVILLAILFAVELKAQPLQFRMTAKDGSESRIDLVLKKINSQKGTHFILNDFRLLEDRDLATSHYQFWVQTLQGTPIRQRSIRIWSDLKTRSLIQAEAQIETEASLRSLLLELKTENLTPQELSVGLDSQSTLKLVRKTLEKHTDDRIIQDITWSDEWYKENLTRYVKVKSRRGFHHIWIDLRNKSVFESKYHEFPQMDIPAVVYPLFEEIEEGFLPLRVPVLLKNIKEKVARVEQDPYLPLRSRRYLEDKFDPILGMDPVFQELGIWSPVFVKNKARELLLKLPLKPNTYADGLLLEGKYVTVNLHPSVPTQWPGINFSPTPSAQYFPHWQMSNVEGKDLAELVPGNALNIRPIHSAEEVLNRVAQRHAEHDPQIYINDGFDEIQVYWAVDTLMTTMHTLGLRDPELSTRPFNAVLYDPDISMRDNAYYVDDTINFTTYSAKAPNYARDNTTIWHELGHGIMDRLMGDFIELADTGGLSEGMADFLAQLIIHSVTEGKPYEGLEKLRINNQIGFNLTNEVHDDGEAYGGTMNDFLLKAISKYGHSIGVAKVADLTFEAMRLSRNHPGLSAQDWFNHMLFADEIKSSSRNSGELAPLLIESLKGRNYAFDSEPTAQFKLLNGEGEVTSSSPGARGSPISLEISPEQKTSFAMKIQLKGTETYKFKYPVTVRVQFQGGPIQGAIRWINESDRENAEAKQVDYFLKSEEELLNFKLTVSGKCDYVNRDDGSCVDYAYVQIWNHLESMKPVAKKRFYLRVKNSN